VSARRARSELKSTGYEIFIGVLSILSIVNLALLYAVRGDPDLQRVLDVMNGVLSAILLADFLFRLVTAPSRSRYFFRDFGWADLLASLPLAQLKFLRVFRLVRVVRLLRALGARTVLRALVEERAGSALLTLLLLGVLVLQFGSLWILNLEQDAPGANILTASDALWYTIVTISTVGYGDRFPVTNTGRTVGAVIIVIGVGIFGTFTGYLANAFLSPRRRAGEAEPAPDVEAAPAAGTALTDTAGTAPTDTETLAALRTLVSRPDAALADVEHLLADHRSPPGR
jgi:voltage-gated potassium channel